MKLEYSFTRTDVTLVDAVPVDAAYLTNDNVFHAPQYGVNAEPIEAVALAYHGPVAATALNAQFYLWDENTTQWYLFATQAIVAESIVYVSLPNVIDRQDSRGISRISVAVVIGSPDPVVAGDYEFALASATAVCCGGSADIEEPIEVEGATAEGDVPVTNPLDLAAVVQDADPGPFIDGILRRLRLDEQGRLIVTPAYVEPVDPGPLAAQWRFLRLDDEGRLIVTDPTAGGGEVEGVVDDDDPVGTTKPVVIGGVYLADPTADTLETGDAGWALMNALRMLMTEPQGMVEAADPGPLGDGVRRYLRLDDEGRLIVTDPSASPMIQGIDADDDPATANPVLIGGIYLDDPSADTLEDADAGLALLNELRMLITESRVYDPPTDADRVVPMYQSYDNFEPLDFDQLVATDALTTHYWDSDTMPYFSLLLATTTALATISVTISASNDADEPDITLRNYTDITSEIYGGPINLTSAAAEVIVVDTPIIFNSYRITFDSDIAAVWTARGKQGAQ